MGHVLDGSATTTEAVRRAIQHSQESLRTLAKRHGINQKTVAKWRKRTSVTDQPTGPKEPKSTVLTVEEEAVIVAFRRHALLPLDDCLYALQATIPKLTRSSLRRCLQRHGFGRHVEEIGAEAAGVIAIDGKTLRRCFDRAAGHSALQVVTAFTSQEQLVLAQKAVAEGGNEIIAARELLELFDCKGALVTAEAIPCTAPTVAAIRWSVCPPRGLTSSAHAGARGDRTEATRRQGTRTLLHERGIDIAH